MGRILMNTCGSNGKRSGAFHLPAIVVMAIVAIAALWPGPAAAWWNDQWTLRKKITIDTGATGAAITDPIGTTPILVRLHLGNFRFGSAKEDGGDLRFIAADDKTPLKYHVEKFDSLLGEALVWVSVPDLRPGTKTELWLYFGNPKAVAAGDAKGTYDPDTLLVYHFAEHGVPALDSSAWASNAQNAVPSAEGSIIGSGARLDGQTPLLLPAAPSLVVPESGALSWSLWVNMTAAQPRAVLYARHEGPNSVEIVLENGVPFVEVTNGGTTQRSGEGAAITPGTWRHLAMTADGARITLYVDGNPFSTLAAVLPTMTGTASVGGDAATTVAPGGSAPATAAAPATADAPTAADTPAPTPTSAGFAGDIDELQIAKAARPAGFIKLAAIGQGPEQAKLIAFSVDEENAGWSTGYLGVILKSVTLDGWVVIGLLGIMAVFSGVVMVDKVAYLNRVSKGNALFLTHYRDTAMDLDAMLAADDETFSSLGGRVAAKDRRTIQRSSLYHLFHRSVREIRRRFNGDDQTQTLSPQSIAAIRAAIESAFITETQRMNKLMVVLTIAISGGPFLGLLGTVVGVMITFAAIAQSGDVNVNAIAPGIAAALVATVAGLVVAIPALFGYNYLITRIKDMSAEMLVFVDELVTKMAESYHPRPSQPHKIAAE